MPALDLVKLKRMVEAAVDLSSEARAAAERARDYYDGHQWTAAEVAQLARRKQPIITNNRIQRKIDAMVGIEQRSRTDPRAYPRNPADEDAADVATKALDYVETATRFDMITSSAFENLLVEGYGGCEVVVEERGGRLEVVVNRLRWEEIFFDPHSREKDFSDAGYIGFMKWMTRDDAMNKLAPIFDGDEAKLEKMLIDAASPVTIGDTYEDRPREGQTLQWADKKAERVRVVQMYYQRAGEWYLAIFCGGGEILNDLSPYLDEDGKTDCPIELMTAYIDRENRRYGVVRSMMSSQDEINARRSKLLHMLNTRQTWGVKGAVDVASLKRELAKPDGHVEIEPEYWEAGMPQPFQMINNNDQVAGQFNLLVESKQEIDNLGPNASLHGQMQGAQSGRAIMAQQQAGLVELAPVYDVLRDWKLRCYRQMWMRIRQYWTEERWIRVTDDMEAPQFLQVNALVMTPFGPQMVNSVAEMDLDILIDESPDIVSLRHEQFQHLLEMVQAGIQVPPELIIEASNLRNKQRINEMIEGQQQQMMQMQMQAMSAEQQKEMIELQAEVGLKQANAQAAQARAAKDLAAVPGMRADASLKTTQATSAAMLMNQRLRGPL